MLHSKHCVCLHVLFLETLTGELVSRNESRRSRTLLPANYFVGNMLLRPAGLNGFEQANSVEKEALRRGGAPRCNRTGGPASFMHIVHMATLARGSPTCVQTLDLNRFMIFIYFFLPCSGWSWLRLFPR